MKDGVNDRATARGPGLAKTRGERALHYRSALLVRGPIAHWAKLIETADVVSEGAQKDDADGPTWYGSTSLVLELHDTDLESRVFLATIARRDPHVRLRAVRIARREASSRAPAPLGRAVCEVRASEDPRGVRIDVDLQAPLIVRARLGAHRGRPKPNTP